MHIFTRLSYTHGTPVNEYRYYPNPLTNPNSYVAVKDKHPLGVIGISVGVEDKVIDRKSTSLV